MKPLELILPLMYLILVGIVVFRVILLAKVQPIDLDLFIVQPPLVKLANNLIHLAPVQPSQFLLIFLYQPILKQEPLPERQLHLPSPFNPQDPAIHPLRLLLVVLIKVQPLLVPDIDQLMIHSLTSVVNQVRDGDHGRLTEIVPETACHHSPVTVVETLM